MTLTNESAATGVDEVGLAVRRAREAFDSGRTRSLDHRRRQIDGVLAILERHETDLCDALGRDLGRAPFDAFIGDIASTRIEASFAKRYLKRWLKPQRVRMTAVQWPGRAEVRREPLGVVAVVGPWNYPVYLTLAPLVAAVAAGNAVVVKPSEWAPATAELLADLVPRYLDPESVAVVLGDHAATEAILAGGIDHLFFTGGTVAGEQLRAAAAASGASVTLELGGKCPAIVAADADLDVAARRIGSVALWNGGQTCVRSDYVLVEETVADAFVERLADETRRFASDGVQRLSDPRHVDRVRGLLAQHGGTVVLGGHVDTDSARVEPTIVVDPAPTSALLTDEIFAPVLPVVSVPTTAAAIARVAEKPPPLAIYLFTRSAAVRDQVVAGTRSGAVVVNEVGYHIGNPRLPFGGVGASGTGVYHGRWGFDTLSHPRVVFSRSTRPDFALRYPPYSASAQRLIRRMLT